MISKTFIRVRGLYKHYLFSMKRNPARIIETLVWPLLEIILFGFLAVSGTIKSAETTSTITNILIGIVYWNWTARIIQESVAQFLDDIVSKNFQNLIISPITHAELILGITLVSLTKIIITFLVISFALFYIYPTFFTHIGLHIFLWILQLELTGVALSFVGIGFIFLFGARLSFIGWGISTVLQIFSLVFYERSALPLVLQLVSYAIPPSYIFEEIRSINIGFVVQSQNILIATLLNLIYLFISFMFFRFAYIRSKKIGTFAKL